MSDLTPEEVRLFLKVWRLDELHPDTIRAIAEAYLEAERKLAAVDVLAQTTKRWVGIDDLRAALGGDHERGPDEADAPTTPALAGDHEQPDTGCPCGDPDCLSAAHDAHYRDHEQPTRPEVWVDLPADVDYDSLNDWQPVNVADHDQPEHDNDCSSGAGFVDPYCTVCTPGPIRGDHEQPKPERTAEVDAAMRDFMGRMFGGPMSGGPHG